MPDDEVNAASPAVVMSTAGVAEKKAFDHWQDVISETFVPLVARPVSSVPFRGVVEHRSVGDLQLTTVRAGAQEVCRTNSLIARGGDEYVLASLQVTGVGLVEQGGREARLRPGAMTFYDSTRPYRLRFEDRFEQYVMQVPRRVLPRRALSAMGVVLPPTAGLQLITRFLVGLSAIQDEDPVGAALLEPHAIGLLGAAIGTGAGSAPTGIATTVLDLERVRAFLRTAAVDPALSADRVAAACHVSRRSLFRLFEEEPDGFAGTVRRIRVEFAQRHLWADPTAPLATVAAKSGFAGPAQLHRSFREETGTTPAAWRAEHGRIPSSAGTHDHRSGPIRDATVRASGQPRWHPSS